MEGDNQGAAAAVNLRHSKVPRIMHFLSSIFWIIMKILNNDDFQAIRVSRAVGGPRVF